MRASVIAWLSADQTPNSEQLKLKKGKTAMKTGCQWYSRLLTRPKNLTFYKIRKSFEVRKIMSSWLLFCNFGICTTLQCGLSFNFIDSSENKVRILLEIKYLLMKLQLQKGFWFIVPYYSIARSSLACLVFHLLSLVKALSIWFGT